MNDKMLAVRVIVIGGGPAGLFAAEILGRAGLAVTVHERMPTVGRRLLMAGRGGLNLTHSEPLDSFLGRYGAARPRLESAIRAFPPAALRDWAEGLGQPTFVGSSGRVFPKAMKASPLLRAWLGRLADLGVEIVTGSDWLGWDAAGRLRFRRRGEEAAEQPRAVLLALGGASWPRLGSDGGWTGLLAARGVVVTPLRPANCGFETGWSENFRERFQGQPLKNVALSFAGRTVRGEILATAYGLEGGAVYALSAELREAIALTGEAELRLDLCPDRRQEDLIRLLSRPRGAQSHSTFLRRALGLAPIAVNLLREAAGRSLPAEAAPLAALMRQLPIRLTAARPLARAISTAGGIALSELDDNFMLKRLPGLFAAGEMLDWEAPTGGYLLQGAFASGAAAARGMLSWLRVKEQEER